jgi:hypothetical protein
LKDSIHFRIAANAERDFEVSVQAVRIREFFACHALEILSAVQHENRVILDKIHVWLTFVPVNLEVQRVFIKIRHGLQVFNHNATPSS